MYFLKILLTNFLIVFFANHILPGIDTTDQTKLPHIGGDLMFAIALAILNSLIYPILKLVKQEPSFIKIMLVALVINFVAYAIVKFIPVGIHTTLEGYLIVAIVVTVGSVLTNYLEMKHYRVQNLNPPNVG